ncbi:hypothetical protein AB6A40_003333 [Gnathostoma spinigerum]|uniref:Uncharacterized protein n=1 Tax=Gnathostoma spinigerum TaxID=75299 RepID=A0ABD6EH18_9BILA
MDDLDSDSVSCPNSDSDPDDVCRLTRSDYAENHSARRRRLRTRKWRSTHSLIFINDSTLGEENEPKLLETGDTLSKVEEASRSGSVQSEREPPSPAPAFLKKRHSLFQPRTSDAIPELTVIESVGTPNTSPKEPQVELKDITMPSTSGIDRKPSTNIPPLNVPSLHMQTGITAPLEPPSIGVPHSQTWGPQLVAGQFPSAQSLNQPGQQFPYYPMPFIGPSASMPYGLSSPVMLSPYGTLQMSQPPRPSSSVTTATSETVRQGTESVQDTRDLSAYQLSMTLDQYNQHLMRSQLDQAQQTAQVASCQVQLLRDQLNSETTARIEAQSRTHQLLNANRELLEQVQALVGRLQVLESRLAAELETCDNQPSTSKFASPQPSSTKATTAAAMVSTATNTTPVQAVRNLPSAKEVKLPGPPPIDPSKPYQLQTLADLRAGSLPPEVSDVEKRNNATKRRTTEKDGARTEPESGADDTTDYSSSDQYEKTAVMPISSITPQANLFSYMNVLMANPQVRCAGNSLLLFVPIIHREIY